MIFMVVSIFFLNAVKIYWNFNNQFELIVLIQENKNKKTSFM
jgi:hypothetical protein